MYNNIVLPLYMLLDVRELRVRTAHTMLPSGSNKVRADQTDTLKVLGWLLQLEVAMKD
jgi:hypothetical protein